MHALCTVLEFYASLMYIMPANITTSKDQIDQCGEPEQAYACFRK